MIRYCQTARAKLSPCKVGHGSYSAVGCVVCYDEPKEINCRYLVDENIPQFCPYCGSEFKQVKKEKEI